MQRMSNDTKASRYDKKTKQRLATKPFSLCTTTTTRSLQTTDSRTKKKKLDAARSTPRGLAAHGRSRPHSRSHMPKSMCGCYVNTRPSMSQRLPYMSAKHGVDFPRSASRIRKTSKARSSPQRKFSNDLEKSVGVHYLHEAHVCTFGAAV